MERGGNPAKSGRNPKSLRVQDRWIKRPKVGWGSARDPPCPQPLFPASEGCGTAVSDTQSLVPAQVRHHALTTFLSQNKEAGRMWKGAHRSGRNQVGC